MKLAIIIGVLLAILLSGCCTLEKYQLVPYTERGHTDEDGYAYSSAIYRFEKIK